MSKKRHGHNFEFSGLKKIAGVVHPISYPAYSFQAWKIKIVAVSLFFDILDVEKNEKWLNFDS